MTASATGRFGRFAEPALWVVVALGRGPRAAAGLLDELRASLGRIGPGTLYGTIARLERVGLIEPVLAGSGRAGYRLRRTLEPVSGAAAMTEQG